MLCDHMNNFSHIAYLCCAVSEERLLEIIQASNTEQHRKSETQKKEKKGLHTSASADS